MRSEGAQLGFINFNTIASRDPQLEERITRDVASYGRQLGWIIEALEVVINGDLQAPTADEQRALSQFAMLREAIGEAKQRTVRDRCDQLIADIQELAKDPLANRNELQRLRAALGPAGHAGS